jgi:hypothetical protein
MKAVYALTASLVLIGCGGTEAVQPLLPASVPSPVQVSWQSCWLPFQEIGWLAVQDGTGPWRQVVGSSGAYSFRLDSARASAAYVISSDDYHSMYVRSYSAEEMRASVIRCEGFTPGKTITGSVIGLAPSEQVDIALGKVSSYASHIFGAESASFTLAGVELGALDLVAVRGKWCAVRSECNAPTGMLIRRGVDIADGGILAPLDFSSTEAFTLTPHVVAVTDATLGDTLSHWQSFRTASTRHVAIVSGASIRAAGSSVPLATFRLPTDRTVSGDQYQISVGANNTGLYRERLISQGSLPDALTLGAAIAPVTIRTPNQFGVPAVSASVPRQQQFQMWFAEFWQGKFSVSIAMSAAYATTGEVILKLPDLTGVAGRLTAWAFAPGTLMSWNTSATDLSLAALEAARSGHIPDYHFSSRSGRVTP